MLADSGENPNLLWHVLCPRRILVILVKFTFALCRDTCFVPLVGRIAPYVCGFGCVRFFHSCAIGFCGRGSAAPPTGDLLFTFAIFFVSSAGGILPL